MKASVSGSQPDPSAELRPIGERVVDASRNRPDRAANDDRAVAGDSGDADNPLWVITVALAVFLALGAALAAQG
jgi:hypothetical protein